MQEDTIGFVKHKLDDPPVWGDLLKIKHIYLKGREILVRNGRNTSFQTDSWIKDKPLCVVAPILFDLCCDKNISVYNFLTHQGQLQFKRWLTPLLFDKWLGLVNDIYNHTFQNNEDIPLWRWNKNNRFSTKSVYDILTRENTRNWFKNVWKAKIPYKIKIFMWLVENNAILTKDNLIKRHWVGSPTCYFCLENETIDHLFFQCPVAKITWEPLAHVQVPTISLGTFNNIILGLLRFYLEVLQSTLVGVLQFAGISGSAETKLVLTRK